MPPSQAKIENDSDVFEVFINEDGDLLGSDSQTKPHIHKHLCEKSTAAAHVFDALIAAAITSSEPIDIPSSIQLNINSEYGPLSIEQIDAKSPSRICLRCRTQDATIRQVVSKSIESILDSINEGVISTDANGVITQLNPTAENLLACDAPQLLGKPLSQTFKIVDQQTHQPWGNLFAQILKTALPVARERDVVLQTLKGKTRMISFDLTPVFDGSGAISGSTLVFNDIGHKLKIEAELEKMQRMESLAFFSASIAHDFNNYLTAVIGNLSLARHQLSKDHPTARILELAEKSSLRAKSLTDRLFSFSKGHTPQKEILNIHSLIDDCASFVYTGSHCQCAVDIPPNIWFIEADEGQLTQVFNNLFINALQASKENQKVCITAKNREMIWESSLQLQNGSYVEMRISDEGDGIPKENLSKLFEPYFTTKGDGNGLGLATTYTILKKHNAHIEVESELQKGTTFTIYLPAAPHKELAQNTKPDLKIQYGEGTILLIDDELIVQQIGCDMLEHLGYATKVASNGESAVKILEELEQAGDTIDAIIIDLSVNHGSGGKQALQMIRPHLLQTPAILSTGFTHSQEMQTYEEMGFSDCILKPYTIEQLSWTLKNILQN